MAPDRKLPLARPRDKLLIERIQGELLVYDTASQQGHCLNPVASIVWERCNGETSMAEVVAALEQAGHGDAARNVDAVLAELALANLLADVPPTTGAPSVSRRGALARMGLVAGGVAGAVLVQSIWAPPAWAGCSPSGQIPLGGCNNCCNPCPVPPFPDACCGAGVCQ